MTRQRHILPLVGTLFAFGVAVYAFWLSWEFALNGRIMWWETRAVNIRSTTSVDTVSIKEHEELAYKALSDLADAGDHVLILAISCIVLSVLCALSIRLAWRSADSGDEKCKTIT